MLSTIKYHKLTRGPNLGILAQVSDAHAMAFSFPHHATALSEPKKNTVTWEDR